MIFKLIPFLLIIGIKSSFSQSEIHISSSGSDLLGTGDLNFPYATLKKAILNLRPGNQLFLHEGIYEENNLKLFAIGSKDEPIIIRNYKDEKVILVGEKNFSGDLFDAEYYGTLPSILDIRDSKFIVISNLEFKESKGMGVSIWNSENIIIKNCIIHDTWSRGLGGNGKNLFFIENEVYRAALQNENESILRDRARGLQRYWSAGTASWFLPDGKLSENVTWKKNKIHDNWGEGIIALHVLGAVIEENSVYDNYSNHIYIDHSKDVVVKKNIIKNTTNRYYRTDAQYIAPAIMIASEFYSYPDPLMTENLEISYNEMDNVSVGIGFWRDPDNLSPLNRYKNVSIHHNHLKNITVIPFSFRKINTDQEEEPSNFLYENTVESTLPWRFENPEIWTISK